ncbi:MAG: sigma-54 dependent transcriptional regulator [Acidobacteriota bacterium]
MSSRRGAKTTSSSTAGVPDVVLVVEDEQRFREMVVECLTGAKFVVHEAVTAAEAIVEIGKRKYDAVLTDFRLPGHDGFHVLAAANDSCPDAAVILMTGYGTVELAVDAMKMGADDFVSKPFELARLPHVLRHAIDRRRLRAENRELKESRADEYRMTNIVGRAGAMRKVQEQVEAAILGSQNVLLIGEPGTGKGRIAKTIHYSGARKDRQFVPVRCGSMSEPAFLEDLVGTLLTPRTADRPFKPGRLLLAHKGTLFLDGIEALSDRLQAKLAAFFLVPILPRSGSGKHTKVDVRVIASTHPDLPGEKMRGRFDRHMYSKLSQLTIHVPRLRDHREDIPALVQHFLRRFALDRGTAEKTFSPQALQCIVEFAWPGNVSELKSTVERMAITTGKREIITAEDLSPEIRRDALGTVMQGIYVPEQGINVEAAMERIERRFVEQGLKTAAGNKSRAAELLGVKRSTLGSMLRRLKLLGGSKEPE